MAAYKTNLSVMVTELQHMLPCTRVWAMHTNPLSHKAGDTNPWPVGYRSLGDPDGKVFQRVRVIPSRVAHTNSWIRQASTELGIGLADWDQMLGMQWPRSSVLGDDGNRRESNLAAFYPLSC